MQILGAENNRGHSRPKCLPANHLFVHKAKDLYDCGPACCWKCAGEKKKVCFCIVWTSVRLEDAWADHPRVNRQAANNLPTDSKFHLSTASIHWLCHQYCVDERSWQLTRPGSMPSNKHFVEKGEGEGKSVSQPQTSLIQFRCLVSGGVSAMIGAVIAGLMLSNQAIVV